MIAAELFHDFACRSYAAAPEIDPLREDGALQESALVGIRFEAVKMSVGLLFDLRGALQLREGVAGVLIARRPRRLEWIEHHNRAGYIWYAVTGSTASILHGRFRLRLGFAPDADLEIEAAAGEFYIGDVPDLDEVPPDFVQDSEAVIRAGMPSWDSELVPTFATFLDL